MLLLLLGCASEPVAPWSIPEGATVASHDPDVYLDVFPDDAQTVPDPSTATGLRVRLRDDAAAALRAEVGEPIAIVEALEELDGFGVSAGVTLRFTAPVDPASFLDAARWVRVDDGADVPFTPSWTDDGATVVLSPWFVLAERTRYAVVVDDGLVDAAGEPVW
ncbi:MAG TPA: Ig-like domain-containing protein, partial [Myxococcota bacterium]|nr:Ig-like domain-containing protein [Myxococcota bacterium]